jgi:ribose transport system substrate-binding protein
MRKATILSLALILALSVVVPAAAQSKGYTIAFFVKDSTTPFWRYLINGAKKEAALTGSTVIEYAPIQTQNLEEQLRQVEDAIQKKVDAICIAPINSQGIIPAIEKANAAGIPVITTNTRADGGKIETYVGVENFEGAKAIGEQVMKKIGGKGNIVIIEGNPAGQTNIDRLGGFKAVLAKYPGVKLLSQQPAMFRRDQAMTVMENLLQTFPKIDAVIALNDEMALGALRAIEAAGRKGIVVSGFDGAVEGLEASRREDSTQPWTRDLTRRAISRSVP